MGRFRRLAVTVLAAAVATTGVTSIGSIAGAAGPEVTEYTIGDASDHPEGLAYGPDGNIWVAQRDGERIDRVSPNGEVKRFPLPKKGNPARIVAGPDGAMWYTLTTGNRIGRITVEGSITEYQVPTKGAGPHGLTRRGNNELWFTEPKVGKVARIDLDPPGDDAKADHPRLRITEYDAGQHSSPTEIATGSDGAVWFTDPGTGTIGRVVDGKVAHYTVPTKESGLAGIAPAATHQEMVFVETSVSKVGSFKVDSPSVIAETPVQIDGVQSSQPVSVTLGVDGALWLTAKGANAIVRIDAERQLRSYAIPSDRAEPNSIVVGPGKDLWFTERATGKLGRIAPLSKPTSTSSLDFSVRPSAAAAGHEETRSKDIPASALSNTNILQSSPLRSIPLRSIPLRSIPLRSIPLRSIPLRSIPLRSIPLSTIPLRSITWQEVLVGTIYEGVPLQSITLEQVLSLDPLPASVAALALADLSLEDTPLRSISLAGLMFLGVPLDRLPPPTPAGWCAFLTGQPLNCSNGVDPAVMTIAELELGNEQGQDDLSAYYTQQIDLAKVDLTGIEAPFAQLELADVKLDQTPLGSLASSDFPSLVICTSATCPTLTDAQTQNALAPGATVGAFLALLPAGGISSLGLGQLLAGIVVGNELPFEDGPLSAVLDNAQIRKTELLAYQAKFTVACDDINGLHINFTLGAGFRPLPGSARLDHGEGSTPVPDPEQDGNLWRFAPPTGPDGICDGANPGDTATETLVVDVEPAATLGNFQATAGVSTLIDRSASLEAETNATSATVTSDASHDAGNDEGSALPIRPDSLYTGHIAESGDVDLYTIEAPTSGSTLNISLSHLPADYDLVVYGPDASIPSTPLRSIPLRSIPLRSIPVEDDGSDPANDGDNLAPGSLQGIPLRSIPLRSISLKRGTDTESVSVPVFESDKGKLFTIQVSGYDGASSEQPYVLRATVEPGPDPLPCRTRAFKDSGVAGTFPSTPLPATTKTLILVDSERMGALYGNAEAATMLSKLQAYAARPEVAGVVVPVESDPNADVREAMQAWDADPCDSEKANAVVGEINQVVDNLRPGLTALRSVVLVGADDALPHARVPDLVSIANEKEYADAAIGGKDSATSRALASGLTLSDDPYGDFDPQVWLSGKLYVPDVALGRLIETPAEISAQLDQYTSANGILDPTSGSIMGYDFLVDGSQAVKTALDTSVTTDIRTDNGWTSADALTVMNSPAAKYLAVNAHYNHFQALPAKSFTDDSQADLLESKDANPASGSVLFTMGCHAGLNVPDIAVSAPGPADQKRLADWAQVAAGKQALFTGNTGFGYGDTDVVAYSERLMQHYAEGLAGKQVTAGQALMFAKQRYIGDLGVTGVYDAKVVEESVFYGLPTYRITSTGGEAGPALSAFDRTKKQTAEEPVVRTAPFSTDPKTERVNTKRGSYWSIPGQSPQVTHYRPVEPRLSLDVTPEDGLPVHGAVIEDQTSTDVNDVNPVFSRPTIDLSAREPEKPSSVVAFPEQQQFTNLVQTPKGKRDFLVLIAGQTVGDHDGPARQRLFGHFSGQLYRSNSTDWTPPQITRTEGLVYKGFATFSVETADDDVTRAIVLYRDNATATWRRVELQRVSDSTWSAGVRLGEGATNINEYNVQLVDRAGNVGVATNKGRQYSGEIVKMESKGIELQLEPGVPDNGFYREPPAITISGLDKGEGALLDIDGGALTRYEGAFTVKGEGFHVIRAISDSGKTAVTFVGVDTSGPGLTGSVSPDPNEAGWRKGPATVTWTCGDAVSGVASCPGPTVLADDGKDQSARATATDRVGNVGTGSVTGISIDQTRPLASIIEPYNGIVRVGKPLTGKASDGLSGVTGVSVTYRLLLSHWTETVDATLTCDASKSSCAWSAKTPSRPGIYTVTAKSSDLADNVSKPDYAIIIVIN